MQLKLKGLIMINNSRERNIERRGGGGGNQKLLEIQKKNKRGKPDEN